MFSSKCQLLFSSNSRNPATNSRSTSIGDPSGRAFPLAVTSRGAHQAGIDVSLFFDVRVIHPDDRAAFAVGRAGALWHRPRVGVGRARRHCELLSRPIVVLRAL